MTKKSARALKINALEQQFLEQLREHPDLMERFQTILEIMANTDGPIKRADEVEGLLIEAMRRLGHTTMGSWAVGAEKRLAEQLKQRDASARVLKKKR